MGYFSDNSYKNIDNPTATVNKINTLYHGDNTRAISPTVAAGLSFKNAFNNFVKSNILPY